MPKNKRPVPRKSAPVPPEDDELLAAALADLALTVAEQEDGDLAALRVSEDELHKLVRNALRKKHDEVLYGAVERTRYADAGAYQLLRAAIEEAAATVLLRREGAPTMEINAFMVPMFVHSQGGLDESVQFQDGAAFEALVASFQQAGLESAAAKVVLISHAYDFGEVDRITYSHLNDMLRDAAASMNERKLVATPAIERSLAGWDPRSFEAGDTAVELRFLLGFALKRSDDPFYQVPAEEGAADAYFDQRMARYVSWTEEAAPLVARCLAAPAPSELHFLYQDLFYGAKQQGMDELAMLQLMSEVGAVLGAGQLAPEAVQATVGAAAEGDELLLRLSLAGADGVVLATVDKALDVAADLEAEIEDLRDALATLGITNLVQRA
ncbi:MAG: hypothetical protein V4508_01265 [Pseudomonadota bacterium]